MSFVISCVLACTTILATFMLQLADDDLNSGSSIIGVVSLVAILSALYIVDYRKKFALSKGACNFLLILAVAFQFGALTHSRQEILAFAIANILASLQAILFFQSKTLRKCYQILFISFVEVAVGCVFQRSAFFVAALPIYAILSFLCFSLLFLWGERKYYTERVVLKRRFSGNKNLQLISAEEPIHQLEEKPLDAFDSAAALAYGKKAGVEDSSRFFRRPSIPAIRYEFSYFRRFVAGALTAFLFAAFFFSLFPRMEEFGFGMLTFDNISWGGAGGARTTRTGFSPKIELGDLGPSLDSHETVMTVRFMDCLNSDDPFPLDPLSAVYFRGMPLPNYNDRSWSELRSAVPAKTLNDLRVRISQYTQADPDFILSYLLHLQNRDASNPVDVERGQNVERDWSALAQDPPRLLYQLPPRDSRQMGDPWRIWDDGPDFTPFNPRSGVPDNRQFPPEPDVVSKEMFRAPYSGNLIRSLPEQRQFSNFKNYNDIQSLADLISQKQVDVSKLRYDVRTSVVAYDVDLKPLDTNVVFAPSASYVAKSVPDLYETNAFSLQLFTNREHRAEGGKFWFVSTSVINRQQTSLTPNQEIVWPYLQQYLEIDADKFPKLIALAREWDKESGIPEENFIARARYFESKLRDTGEYKYNRTGVLRNQSVDPLEDFISENKAGHCEYFAGGLALLLRAVGIPSRVVVGFACYPNADGKPTAVRQSDAHSWVEAYIPPDKLPRETDKEAYLFAGSAKDENGSNFLPKNNMNWISDGMWLRLDATPASDRDSDRPDALTLGIYTWSNLFRSFGHDFILNFNGAQQMRAVYTPLVTLWKRCVAAVQSTQNAFDFLNILFDQCKETLAEMFRGRWTPSVVLRFAFLVAFLAIVGGIVRRVYRFFKNKLEALRKAAELEAKKTRRNCPAAVFYLRLEKSMETRLKTRRQPNETPREFIERCFAVEDELVKKQATPSQKDNAVKPKHLAKRPSQSSKVETKELFVPTSVPVRKLFRELVEIYYRSQFGAKPLSSEERDRWSNVLKDAQIS